MIPTEQWSAPWTTDDRCMRHQAEQAEIDIRDWLNGKPHAAFDALKAVFSPISSECKTFLEVGAGCGYGYRVVASIAPDCEYTGVDISIDMVRYANLYHGFSPSEQPPGCCRFLHGSAEKLPFQCTVDCVCLAAVIQHVPDWQAVIREAVRISRRYLILHRVQCTTGETNEFVNPAYETELPTRENSERELLAYCEEIGLYLLKSVRWGNPQSRFNASYLFEKT